MKLLMFTLDSLYKRENNNFDSNESNVLQWEKRVSHADVSLLNGKTNPKDLFIKLFKVHEIHPVIGYLHLAGSTPT